MAKPTDNKKQVYISQVETKKLRQQLKEGAIVRAERDLKLVNLFNNIAAVSRPHQ